MISTLPPTQCGLATFAQALSGGFAALGADVDLVRVLQEPRHRLAGLVEPESDTVATSLVPEPVTVPWAADRAGLQATAEALNRYDVVILQHEYGIYGGPDGERVLGLLELVRVPVVTVLHTVLARPSARQHRVLREVIAASAVVVTMTHLARARAIQVYGADPDRAVVIPHGAAEDLVHGAEAVGEVTSDVSASGGAAGNARAPLMLTWGLLGRGKGIEWAIRAMATLSDLSPHPHYLVAGRTHPRLSMKDGTGYRHELRSLAAELGLASAVTFDDRYLDAEALHALVRRADVVLLPYDSLEQVTSGVLTEAVAAGRPVIATRFPHAVELLGDGTGLLVDQGDAGAIAHGLRRILTEDGLAERLSRRAEQLAAGLSWRAVAQEYLRVCTEVGHRVVVPGLRPTLDRVGVR